MACLWPWYVGKTAVAVPEMIFSLVGRFQLLPLHVDSKHPKADATFFQRREFCFTLDGDIFIRYQSFKVTLHRRQQALDSTASTSSD